MGTFVLLCCIVIALYKAVTNLIAFLGFKALLSQLTLPEDYESVEGAEALMFHSGFWMFWWTVVTAILMAVL